MYVNNENASGVSKCEKESKWCTALYKKKNSKFKFDPKKNKWVPMCKGKKTSWTRDCTPVNCSGGPRQCKLEKVTKSSGVSTTFRAKCADGKYREYKPPKKAEDTCKSFGGLFGSKKAPPRPTPKPAQKSATLGSRGPMGSGGPMGSRGPMGSGSPMGSRGPMGSGSSMGSRGPMGSGSSMGSRGPMGSGSSMGSRGPPSFMDTSESKVSMAVPSSRSVGKSVPTLSSSSKQSSAPISVQSQCPPTTIIIQQPEPLYDYEDQGSFWSTPNYMYGYVY